MSDRTPPRTILQPQEINQVAAAVLALGRELWAITDRVTILEAVLSRHGIDAAAEIDAFQIDAEMQVYLDARRDQLIGAISTALSGEI